MLFRSAPRRGRTAVRTRGNRVVLVIRRASGVALSVGLTLASVSGAAAEGVKPLTAAQREILFQTAEDALDKEPCIGTRKRVTLHCRDTRHYVRMNEWHHYIWDPYLRGIGGGYVGIASDQNFTFIAWARSSFAWLLDYDPVVVKVNLIHRAFVRAADTIDGFIALWDRAQRKKARAVLAKEYGSRADLKQIQRIYRAFRREIYATFRRIRGMHRKPAHWLHSEKDYRYIRQMFLADRIRVMKGDLLKDKSLIGIGKAAKKLGVPVRAIYLSNAEEFWMYPPNFRKNFIQMPMDDKSVVLRTRHTNKYGPRIGSYVYIVQGGKDFQRQLADKRTRGVWTMMRHRKPGRPGFFTIGIPVKPESMPENARGGS